MPQPHPNAQNRLFGGAAAEDSKPTAPKVKAARCEWPGCTWKPTTPVDIPRNRLGDANADGGSTRRWFCALHAGRFTEAPDA
jgi:hypothetical protein